MSFAFNVISSFIQINQEWAIKAANKQSTFHLQPICFHYNSSKCKCKPIFTQKSITFSSITFSFRFKNSCTELTCNFILMHNIIKTSLIQTQFKHIPDYKEHSKLHMKARNYKTESHRSNFQPISIKSYC